MLNTKVVLESGVQRDRDWWAMTKAIIFVLAACAFGAIAAIAVL